MNRTSLFALAAIFISQTAFSQKKVTTLQVPGAAEFCKIDPAGYSVLPSGRYVTPAGKAVPITRAPYGLAISPDGQTALVLHNDVVTKIDLRHPDQPVRMPSYDKSVPAVLEGSSCMGIAFLPDGKRAWLSGGDKGTVVLLDVENNRSLQTISLNGNSPNRNGLRFPL